MKLIEDFKQYQQSYNKGFRFNPEDKVFYTSKKQFTKPEGYEDWDVVFIDKDEYLNQRLKELGVTAEENSVKIKDKNGNFMETPVFLSNEHGDIEIIQYSLHRESFLIEKSTTSAGTRFDYAVQKRLNPLYTNFTEGKYDFSEAKNKPFWHPNLLDIFEKGEILEQLVVTEGQFKAYKATKDGVPTVGLTSISHFRDQETKTLHTEILEFIRKCKVKKMVILWDGDCTDISLKAIEKGVDLTNRPAQFYYYASNIEGHLREFFPSRGKEALEVYFATIKTAEIEGNPKGIDDLLTCAGVNPQRVVDNFKNIGALPGPYIHWINISNDKGKKDLRKYFHFSSVQHFYGAHAEKIKGKTFVFFNSTYKVEKGVPVIEISKDLKSYVRIGVDYYKIQKKPFPKIGGMERNTRHETFLTQWTEKAIKDDHGKEAIAHIPKYEGFTNIADHVNYQAVVEGYWNLYDELDHEPRKGDFPNIRKLLKHLFGEQYDNEFILDYLSILYLFPWQKLPVLCLVSKEQNTGKSTFIFLCKLIFKNNMILINSNDLTGDFNDHWTSKLIAASEETFLEKKEAYETIKTLTTAKEITRKEKNKSASSIPCMIHFMFCSNYEDTFIKIGKEDSRLWIVKVKSITEKIKDFDEKLEAEIPQFVNFLLDREIKHERKDRLWFAKESFRTEAFYKVVENSYPTFIRDLKEEIKDYFDTHGDEKLMVTIKDLFQYFGVPTRLGAHYTKKTIKEILAPEQWTENSSYSFKIKDPSNPDQHILIRGKGRYMVFLKDDYLK